MGLNHEKIMKKLVRHPLYPTKYCSALSKVEKLVDNKSHQQKTLSAIPELLGVVVVDELLEAEEVLQVALGAQLQPLYCHSFINFTDHDEIVQDDHDYC